MYDAGSAEFNPPLPPLSRSVVTSKALLDDLFTKGGFALFCSHTPRRESIVTWYIMEATHD